MKTHALPLLVLGLHLNAQTGQLLLSRFPYIPETPRPQALDWQAMLAEIPSPEFVSEPLVFPDELQFNAEERPWILKLRQGYQAVQDQEFPKARDIFEDFLSVFPGHTPTRLALADVLFSLQEYAGAEAAYQQVLREFPQQFQALNNLAWLYATSTDPAFRKPEEALNLTRQALVAEPQSHHVWSTLSQALYAAGRHREAAEAVSNALNRARAARAPAIVLVNYMNQLDRCRDAWLATSFLD